LSYALHGRRSPLGSKR